MRHIRYEPHARDRMEERAITEEHVELTLQQPDETRPALLRREPCTIRLRDIGGRTCKVYVKDGTDPPLVATVAWHGE